MTERPILFSAPMVHAILAGRKSQTRRVVKPEPSSVKDLGTGPLPYKLVPPPPEIPHAKSEAPIRPPCQPGDSLWVREAWSAEWSWRDTKPRDIIPAAPIWYWADGDPTDRDWTRPKPSIHMPRWASRITLRCTDVRVERLNDCSWEDAIAEGLETSPDDDELYLEYGAPSWDDKGVWLEDPRRAYRALWDHINGEGAWAKNPLVWAISFEVVTKP